MSLLRRAPSISTRYQGLCDHLLFFGCLAEEEGYPAPRQWQKGGVVYRCLRGLHKGVHMEIPKMQPASTGQHAQGPIAEPQHLVLKSLPACPLLL